MSIPQSGQSVKGQDWTRFSVADVRCQGHCVEVHLREPSRGPGGVGTRSVVSELSTASRRRLLRHCSRLEFGQKCVPVFLTLTFPAAFPTARESISYLRKFMKRLLRKFPRVSAVWRKELQDRGAPHFHLLMFGMPFVHKRKIQRWWTECVQDLCSADEFNKGVFTRIEAVKSWKRARAYVSKYMSKAACGLDYASYRAAGMVDDDGEMLSSGRWWGVINGKFLPWAGEKRLQCPFGPWFFQLRRSARRIWSGVQGEYAQGFVLYVEDAMEWWRLLDEFRYSVDGDVCPF